MAWKETFELQRQSHENELKMAEKSNEVLKAALAKAHRDAFYFQTRVEELKDFINERPGELPSTDALIQAKDDMFSDLERKAGECYTAFIALDKSSREDRANDKAEIAKLREDLAKSDALVTSLGDSKIVFQKQCQDLFAMLQKRVYPSELTEAMDHYFQLTIQDNSYLASVVADQGQRLAEKDLELESLQAKSLETIRSLEDRQEHCSNLETMVREKDVKLGALQMELDALPVDHQEIIDGRDAMIAGLQGQLREVRDSTSDLLHATRTEGERQIMAIKDDEISRLKEANKEYDAQNQQLLDERYYLERVIEDNTVEVVLAEHELAEKSAQLLAANDKLRIMEERIGGQFGLPPATSVLELLSDREKTSRLRRAQGTPITPWRPQTDEELEKILEIFPE